MKIENQDSVIQEISHLVETLLKHEQMELVEVQFRRESLGWVLRVLIDKSDSNATNSLQGGVIGITIP